MRIAVLTNDYPPRIRGGVGRIAERQVEMLKGAGHEVRVWFSETVWPEESKRKRFMRHLRDLRATSNLVSEICDWKPDVLLTHNLTGCGFGTPRAVQSRGVRWTHMLHDVQLFEPCGQLKNARRVTQWQIFWIWLRFFALGHPDLVVSPTKWLLKQHQKRGFFRFGKTRCEILPNPGPSIDRCERHAHDPLRLLFVGRVTPDKGSQFLLQLVKKFTRPFELHIVGSGSDLERFTTHAVVHGMLEQNNILELMKECDVLLVPSLIEENQPTVILEAASVGLPVIASNKRGMIETLGRAAYGLGTGDPQAWVNAINDLTQDPIQYGYQVERMYEVAKEHDPEIYREKFLSLLTSNL